MSAKYAHLIKLGMFTLSIESQSIFSEYHLLYPQTKVRDIGFRSIAPPPPP